MPHSNVSIFVPHVGCKHMCAFCNQRTITGNVEIPHAQDVKRICSQAISQVKNPSDSQIAFFGGSFTAVGRDYMLELLEAANEFVFDGGFKGIRISTRPDYIDEEILTLLKENNVTAIELGAQSMCSEVLSANERGHTAQDVVNSAKLIKRFGFELGLQMMVGLYKSTQEDEIKSFEKICQLKPDTLRIYPVVILEGTKLGELYKSGEYKPFEFEKAVDLCAGFLKRSQQLGIRVIKLGLHASELVEKQTLGGFYHPAFRELCEGRTYRDEIQAALGENVGYIQISVPKKNLSKALGHKKCNVKYFAERGIDVRIIPDDEQTQGIKIQKIE